MNKLILLVIAITAISCSSSKSTKSPNWSDVTYKKYSGPVSPVYQYNYIINITSTGAGFLSYQFSTEKLDYQFNISSEQLKELKSYISDNNLASAETNKEKTDKHKIGGSTSSLVITMTQPSDLDQKPTMYEYPEFPADKNLEEILGNLYKMIDGYVPKATWDEAKSKRDKYIEENKK